jgi:sporulation protein YlmC with PRC-barrel domain
MSDYEPSPVSGRRFIESDRVEGTAVYDARGHHVGEVKRLIIEKVSGQIAFVIIAFRRFFGIGEGNHALAWNKLHYDLDLEGYRTDVTEEELKAAPDFPVRVDQDDQGDPGFQAYYRIPPSGRAI